MPNQAEEQTSEDRHSVVRPGLSYIQPLKRLEPEPVAENVRSEITSLFDVSVSRGSVELKPSNFSTLPEVVRALAMKDILELRETFQNDVFGKFPVVAKAHTTLIKDMPGSFNAEDERLKGIDRVIVVHQPNMTATPVYHPRTGEFIAYIPEHKTSDFPPAPLAQAK